MKFIDNILNSITMYRLVLYYLIFLLFAALILCSFGILKYNPFLLIISVLFLIVISWITNKIFANAFNAPTNVESVYISALILALIISPIKSISDLPLLFWAAVLAMASKYILAIDKKLIFNPVAIAVILTQIGFNGSASWWIGTASMLPFSLIGLLIVRKIRKYDLSFYFFITSFATILGFSFIQGNDLFTTLKQIIYSSPIFFFAFIMLTEPLTTPPTKTLQGIYGSLVGVLFAPQFHIGSFFTTPEIALVIGNIFSYAVSPKYKLMLKLKEKIKIGADIIDFLFIPNSKIAFIPGQYMELTFSHKNPDSRGNRRYLTIASSPTENDLRFGVKFYPNGSSFKKNLILLDENQELVAGNLAGDFTLPKDLNEKLVFIAGGIGVTPFRSIIKYLIDTNQARSIILLYSNKTADEIVYSDIFDQAEQQLGIKTVYTLTDQTNLPVNWTKEVGRVNATMIQKQIPDYNQRLFYLSGTNAMVSQLNDMLLNMGIKKNRIKKDFFPGF